MHQVSARIWNEVAETQKLRTAWAQQMFPLPQDQLDKALAAEEARLEKTVPPIVASAYLKVMPLLWERTALSNFLKENPSERANFPEVLNPSEAVMLASKDFRLSAPEKNSLRRLLTKEPH